MLRICLIALLCLLAPLGFAREGQGFAHLDSFDGLSGDQVYALAQDEVGFIWIGTHQGLTRYDGRTLKTYPLEVGDDLNPFPHITSLAIAGDGVLWIGTLSQGLVGLDVKTETLRSFRADADAPGTLSDDRIQSLMVDRMGRLWVGTSSGLCRLDGDRFTVFRVDKSKEGSISNNRINGVYMDPEQDLVWVATSGGLNVTSLTQDKFEVFRGRRGSGGLRSRKINTVFRDRTGTLWVGTDRGLHRRAGDRFIVDKPVQGQPGSPSSEVVSAVVEDGFGRLWVGTEVGLDRFDWQRQWFQHNPPELGSRQRINTLFVDRGGVTWVGTNNGLYRAQRDNRRFNHYTHSVDKTDGLSGDQVNAVYQAPDGSLMVGTNRGLDIMRPGQLRFDRFRRERDGLSDNNIQVIAADRRGFFWIGTRRGLNRFDPASRSFKVFRNDPDRVDSLIGDDIQDVTEDGKGRLWIGTSSGLDLMRDRDSGVFQHFYFDANDPDSLVGTVIMTINDTGNGLWVGTDQGLNRLEDGEGLRFKSWVHDPQNPNSLVDNVITSTYHDRSGRLWVGAYGGLSLYNQERDDFRTWRPDLGGILAVMGDDSGMLWLTTRSGLVRFNPKDETFVPYGINKGVPVNFFNEGATYRGLQGDIWFGGKGLISFNPSNLYSTAQPPSLVITSVTAVDRLMITDLVDEQTLELGPRDNYLTIQFSVLDYTDPSANQYRYILENSERSWRQSNLGAATYPKLDPGRYTFRLEGANADGVISTEGPVLHIHIRPHWWASLWFIVLCVALGLGLIGLLFMGQRVRLKRQEAEALLNLELNKKTQELEEARKLQLSMLPAKLPQREGVDLAVTMQTATEVGGDYYDFFEGPNDALTLAVGDATGHGLMAGTLVAATKSLFLSLADEADLPAAMQRASRAIRGMRLRKLFMALALVRLKGHQLSIVSAGMPDLMIYRTRDDSVETITMRGLPLGTPPFPYNLKKISLDPGDVVLFSSDGLEEIFNHKDQMLGIERVREEFARAAAKGRAQDVVDHLRKVGRAWAGERPFDDDVTMLVLRRPRV